MKAFLKKSLSPGDANFKSSIGLLIMRLFCGGIMLLNHGLGKLEKGPASLPNPLNMNATFNGSLIIFAEVVCAVFIIAGFATRWACAVLCILMSVAFFIFHEASLKEGELALAYLASFAALIFLGPGAISIDKFFGKK